MITDDMTDEQIEVAVAFSRVHKLFLDVQKFAVEKLGHEWVAAASKQWCDNRIRFGNDDIHQKGNE